MAFQAAAVCLGVGLIPIMGTHGGKDHPHQTQEGAERGQEGHVGVENTKTGWENWALGSKRAGCNKAIMGKVMARKGGVGSLSSAGYDKVRLAETAARTFGVRHQGNPLRTATKRGVGWSGRRQARCHGEEQTRCLSLWRDAGRAGPAWTQGSGLDRLLRFLLLHFPLVQPRAQPCLTPWGDQFTATFCHFTTRFPK